MLRNFLKISLRTCPKRHASTVAATKPKPKNERKQKPLISCKRKQFELWTPADERSKFGTVPLASSGWLSNKSLGDYFTMHATVGEEQIRAEMHDIDTFLRNSNLRHFNKNLFENLQNNLNIKQLTNIQVNAIPNIYMNNHVLVAAETGCGKTLAYLLPILQKVLEYKENPSDKERKLNSPLALIVTPGRELAEQIGNVAKNLGQNLDLNVKTILGGNTKKLMMSPEFGDLDIMVATIGALNKLVTTGIYRMDQVRHVVLDEADSLLDDSFSGKVAGFLKRFPFHKLVMSNEPSQGTQLVLASATMPTNTEEILETIIDVETLQQIVSPNLHKLMPHVEQHFQRLSKASRPVSLLSLVKSDLNKNRPVIIFSNKTPTSDFVDIFLNNNGVKCINLNGDMMMKLRIGRFEQFQNGEFNVLSTTDVGSRGLDTTRARHIINYDFPLHVSDYIHRCGRIGRVGNLQKSLVTNFISSRREISVVQKIEHAARTGGILPNVNANIKNIITKQYMSETQEARMRAQSENEVDF